MPSFATDLPRGLVRSALGALCALSFAACGGTDDEMMDEPLSPTGTPSTPTSATVSPSTVAPMSTPPGMSTEPPASVAPPATVAPDPEPSGDMPPVRSTTGPSYATTVEPIFSMKCTDGCHEPGGLLGGPGGVDLVKMDLTQGAGYATLTSGMSVQVPTIWVVGSGLEDSYLWMKLNDTFEMAGGTGAKMPVTGELTADEVAAVQAWIEGGATP